MTGIKDLRALVECENQQRLVLDLTEQYALKVQQERYAAEWKIYRRMFHLGGIALADMHAYVAEHGDVIAALLTQRQKDIGEEGHCAQCVFPSMAQDLMLWAEGKRPSACHQALSRPTAAKAPAGEYQNAPGILRGKASDDQNIGWANIPTQSLPVLQLIHIHRQHRIAAA